MRNWVQSWSSGHKVRFASNAALDISGAFTLSIWARRTSDEWLYLASRGNRYSSNQWGLYAASSAQGYPYWLFEHNSTQIQAGHDSIPNDGLWHHLAVTWDGSDYRFYSDGVLRNTVTDSVAPTGNSYPLDVGYDTGDNGTWGGNLAEFAFWPTTALSGNEIAALYRGSRLMRSPVLRPPLWGLHSPEIDVGTLHATGTVTGTTAVAGGPPVALFTPKIGAFPLNDEPILLVGTADAAAQASGTLATGAALAASAGAAATTNATLTTGSAFAAAAAVTVTASAELSTGCAFAALADAAASTSAAFSNAANLVGHADAVADAAGALANASGLSGNADAAAQTDADLTTPPLIATADVAAETSAILSTPITFAAVSAVAIATAAELATFSGLIASIEAAANSAGALDTTSTLTGQADATADTAATLTTAPMQGTAQADAETSAMMTAPADVAGAVSVAADVDGALATGAHVEGAAGAGAETDAVLTTASMFAVSVAVSVACAGSLTVVINTQLAGSSSASVQTAAALAEPFSRIATITSAKILPWRTRADIAGHAHTARVVPQRTRAEITEHTHTAMVAPTQTYARVING